MAANFDARQGRRPVWSAVAGEESGIGMILVIGIVIFVATLTAAAAAIAVNGLSQSRQRVRFEQSLAAAESGIDFALGRLQMAFDNENSDYPIPSTLTGNLATTCNAAPVALPASFDSAQAEQQWAAGKLTALLAAHPECVKHADTGDWLVLKPATPLVNGSYPRYGKVYSYGWSPSVTDPRAARRLVKAEYVFTPYRPQHAILTGATLTIDSSTFVSTASGFNPSLASVHTNGEITNVNGNPTVYGMVTQSCPDGTCPDFSSNRFFGNTGGKVSQLETQSIPLISAKSFYKHVDASKIVAPWYDLCSDGTARNRDPGGDPCGGSYAGTSPFQGWTFSAVGGAKLWTASKTTASGVYYVEGADVDVGTGNGTIANLTVIADADYASSCSSKRFGNINWDHYGVVAPAYQNLFFYADTDLVTHSNFWAGNGQSSPPVLSGMFVAGDQVDMATSSQGAVGSVLAADQCTSPPPGTSPGNGLITTNSVKNPEVYFDPNGDSPFTTIISTTLWLEYVG